MVAIPEALSLALQHHQAGRLSEAEAVYRQILQAHPNHPDALHLLGVIANQTGQNDLAIEYISKAIALDSSKPEYHNNLGNALQEKGDFDAAITSLRLAVALNPGYAEAHANLGSALARQGKPDEAVALYRRAVTLRPGYADAHYMLGNVLKELGKPEEAIASYRQVLALRPLDIPTQVSLSNALRESGHALDALKDLFAWVAAQPESVELRCVLAETLRGVSLDSVGESARAILASLCNDDKISTQEIAPAVIGLIKNTPGFRALLSSAQSGSDPFASSAPEVHAFTRDSLLLAALPRTVICDGQMEQVLTHLRKCIVLRVKLRAGLAVPDKAVNYDFLCALARQCFVDEYALFVTDDEAQRVEKLRAGLQKVLLSRSPLPKNLEWSLGVLALYSPLHLLTGSERLVESSLFLWSDALQPVLREQVADYLHERRLAEQLTALTRITDKVSQAVRRQYEENPYPRWMSVHHPRPMSVEAIFHRLRPGEIFRGCSRPVSILVAGCGTGHNPIQFAVTVTDCDVLAVDLSRASLAYARRMAERLGVANITFHQADLLEMGKLDRRFSIIDCGGVLHHLKDPLKGWRVLVGLLEPDGMMKIGLYSERGRRSFQAARDYVIAQGFPPTPEGIRKCRRAVLELPDGHPARSALAAIDFYSISGFRDLFMHVQEHCFTIPRIADCLDRLGMRFLGFDCDAPMLGRFRAMFPDHNALADLTLWDRFEEACPGGFTGMYQFWCCRK